MSAYETSKVAAPGASLLHKTGFRPSMSVSGTGKADTVRKYSHGTHGLIEHHSNGSWSHFNGGKLIQEGSSHIDLKKHLASLSSQHAESTPESVTKYRSERFGEHLSKHGYSPSYYHGHHTLYEHPAGHTVLYDPRGEHGGRWSHHHAEGKSSAGVGHHTLHDHLARLHKEKGEKVSQHSEHKDGDDDVPGNVRLSKHHALLKKHGYKFKSTGNNGWSAHYEHPSGKKARIEWHFSNEQHGTLHGFKPKTSQHEEETKSDVIQYGDYHVDETHAEELLATSRIFQAGAAAR